MKVSACHLKHCGGPLLATPALEGLNSSLAESAG